MDGDGSQNLSRRLFTYKDEVVGTIPSVVDPKNVGQEPIPEKFVQIQAKDGYGNLYLVLYIPPEHKCT